MSAQSTSDILWTAEQVVAATGGRATAPFAATGVSIDSRTLLPGDLFVALKGPNFDGHAFAARAFAAGAAAALVARRPDDVPGDAPLVHVGDVERALDALGHAARARACAKVIAVTGSVGKTGTKDMLAAALGAQAKTAATSGNLNNQWGLPLTLARLPADAVYAVIELGMNHPGEILRLTKIARPDIAIITTIAAVHLENFESVFEIAEAKAEIFASMAGGTAVLNRDNPYFPVLACIAAGHGVARIVGFGAHPEAQVRLEHCTLGTESSQITATIRGRRIDYSLAVPGRHWAINSLAALAAIGAAGADVDAAARAMGDFSGLAGRGQRLAVAREGGFDLIDESYNASPTSMRAAFEVLGRARPRAGGRRIVVLGDMFELGPQAEAMHAALADSILCAGIDLVFTAGPMMAALSRALPANVRGAHREDAAALAPVVSEAVHEGDIVTVKGSRGMRMERVVAALRGSEAAAH